MEKRLRPPTPTGPQLRAARAWIGWSLSEASEQTGVNRMTIFKIEAEQSEAKTSTINKLIATYARNGVWFDRQDDRDLLMFEAPAESE